MKSVVYDYALQLVKIPYKWGGSNPISGFDCSGLVQELLSACGMDMPGDQTAQAYADYFIKNGHHNVMGFGSLVFYGENVNKITHVTFMLSDYHVIGANSGGSKTNSLSDADKQDAFVKIRPMDYRKDLVLVVMPKYVPGSI